MTSATSSACSTEWYVWHGGIDHCIAVHTSGPTLDQLAYTYGWNPQDARTAFVRMQKKRRIGPMSDKRRVSSVIQFDMARLRDEDFVALSKSSLDALAPSKPWPAWFDKNRFLAASKKCTGSLAVAPNPTDTKQRGDHTKERFTRPDVHRTDARFALYWPRQRVRSPPMSWYEIRSQVSEADQKNAVPAAQHLHPTWPIVLPGFVSPSTRLEPESQQSGALKDRLLRLAAILHSDALPKNASDSCLRAKRTHSRTPAPHLSIVRALGTDTKHVQGDVFLAEIKSSGGGSGSAHNHSLFVALKRFALSPLDCPPRHLSNPLSSSLLQQPPFIERLVLAMCSELVRQKVTQNLPIYYNWFYCTDAAECAPTQVILPASTTDDPKSTPACACMYIAAEYAPLGNLHAHLKRFVGCRLATYATSSGDQAAPSVCPLGGPDLFVDLSLRALFFQILAGTLTLHRYCGTTHGDLRWENILLQEIDQRSGGHWHYQIDGRDYYVINSGGLVPVLWDFGVSRISHRGIANPAYRRHYAKKEKEIGGGSAHRIDLQTLFHWPPLTDSLQKMMLEPFFDNALAFVRSSPDVDTAALIYRLFGSSAQFTTKPDSKKNPCLGSFSLDVPLDFNHVPPSLIPYFKRSIVKK